MINPDNPISITCIGHSAGTAILHDLLFTLFAPKYKGIGRPRKIDYHYFNTEQEMIAFIIGSPLDLGIATPTLEEIFKLGDK